MKVKIKRVYEETSEADGFRVLVDRIWPRGVRKEEIDAWLKDVAPSNELRKWFNHRENKWEEFKKRYSEELKGNPALTQLKQIIKEHKTVTLVYGAKDEQHNQAVALKEFLNQ